MLARVPRPAAAPFRRPEAASAAGAAAPARAAAAGNRQTAQRRGKLGCKDELDAIPVAANASLLTGTALINLADVEISEGITISPLAGRFHVKALVPAGLVERLAPSFLPGLQFRLDISASMSSPGDRSAAERFAGNELCLFLTFRPGEAEAGSEQWFVDIRMLKGGAFTAPIGVGVGGGLTSPGTAGGALGGGQVAIRLRDDLTASAGPFRIATAGDFSQAWSGILAQVRDALAIQLGNIEVPLDLRVGGALSLPVPIPPAGEGNVLPISVLGSVNLSTEVSSREEGFTVRLRGGGRGTTLGGLLTLELEGSGRLYGPIPSTMRLGDLDSGFAGQLLERAEGGGVIRGRLSAFGLPGRLSADFRIDEGQLRGDARFIGPVGVGGGIFTYDLDEGFSADVGLIGLTRLTLEPAEERLESQPPERPTGPAAWELGSSVTGFGVTGAHITPSTMHVLSAGVGPQFATSPEQERRVGVYGGLEYRFSF
jgi:hypothetical protein